MLIIFDGVKKDIPAVYANDLISRGLAKKADQVESSAPIGEEVIIKKQRKNKKDEKVSDIN